MALAAQRRHAQQIARIDAALQRMEAGDYGYCVQCDAEVPARRLELDPAAPLCVGCAGKGR
jgi:DnaK suppressor protein